VKNTTARIRAHLVRSKNDPHYFNSVVLNRPPYWSGQLAMCQSVVDYRVTCVYSGNAIGKDYWIGGLVPWWLYTRKDSLVIVTGPSQTLIGSVTWKEIRRAIAGSILPFRPRVSGGIRATPALVEMAPGWQALGYSTTSMERASGQHARDLLVVVEEASGVDDEIWDAIESLKYTKLVAIGNPIRADGRFVDLIRQADKDRADQIKREQAVSAIRIPSTESPHAQLDHSPFGLADRTWLEACYRRYGRDSLWVRSHIDAVIPSLSSDQLIPTAWLDYATAAGRPPLPANHPVHRTRRISVDLGEGVGRDSTAILVRDDLGILDLNAGNSLCLADAAEEVARLARIYNVDAARISYDKLGIGRDFRNHLARRGLGDAVGYAGSGRPQDPKAFTNLRGEAAWKLRRRMNPDWAIDPAAPLATRQLPFHIPGRAWWALLREDLEALTYDLVGNQTRLIKKEDLLVRLGRSPDRGDALIQSFAF
jgi:phage terminase large subunit